MQTLEITDEQYAFIQHLREAISEDVVGRYGFVRERDAIQFLIDNLDDDIDFEVDALESRATADVAASVEAAMRNEPDPNELEEVSYDESQTDSSNESAADETDEGSDDDGDDEGDDAETESEEEDRDGDKDDDSAESPDADDTDGSDDGAADDDDMLNRMMSLLETHDDKWEESPSADYRYRVTLPDGTTKDVQTKDDVRALLFKNY